MAYAPAAAAAADRTYQQEFPMQDYPANGIEAEVQELVNFLSRMRDDMTALFDRYNINFDELEAVIAHARATTTRLKYAVLDHFDQRESDIRAQRNMELTALATDVHSPITRHTIDTYINIKDHARRCQALNHLECSRHVQLLDDAIDKVNMHLNLLLWAKYGMERF